MGSILVGTSSWSEKGLIDSGLFYPPSVKTPPARLRYYAQRFPIVEIDTSYYGIPKEQTARGWVEQTPAAFVFDAKAFRLFTGHQTGPQFLPPEVRQALGPTGKKNLYYGDVPTEMRDELWRLFARALAPLREAGKLGVALLQFPPWFTPSPENKAHLEECAAKLSGFSLAVEFRNRTWFETHPERTLDLLRDHCMAHVVVDEPQGFSSSVPALWEVTCPDVAIVRMHGRNPHTWEKKGLTASGDRFDYLYGDEELQGLAENVKRISARSKTVHVFFNNNQQDYAQRNAASFMQLVAP